MKTVICKQKGIGCWFSHNIHEYCFCPNELIVFPQINDWKVMEYLNSAEKVINIEMLIMFLRPLFPKMSLDEAAST